MAKNGGNKRSRASTCNSKGPTKDKSKKDNATKTKSKKPNIGKLAVVRGPKPQAIPATKPAKGLKETKDKGLKIKENKSPNVTLTSYQRADTFRKISNVIKKEKRLRFKGRFISKETQEMILKFSKILDDENTNYTLQDLLNVPEIQNKILITKDTAPKEIFYWNAQNLVIKNKFGEDIELELIDTDGKQIYKGKSEKKTGAALYKFNKQVDNLRRIIETKEGQDSSGFTIPISETRRNGETIKITIDLRGIKPRYSDIKKEVWDKYKTML